MVSKLFKSSLFLVDSLYFTVSYNETKPDILRTMGILRSSDRIMVVCVKVYNSSLDYFKFDTNNKSLMLKNGL